MRLKTILLCIFFFYSLSLEGQGTEFSFFTSSDILKPFLSEMRSTAVKVELAYLNKLDDNYYVRDYNNRPFIESHLGAEAPLLFAVNRNRKIKFSTGGYVGNTLLIDMFESNTSPIINTDYFFGMQAGLLKYTDRGFIRNVGIKLVPIFHESTHIGDEFSLHGYTSVPGFKRVNVSFEAWEIAIAMNDPDTIRTNLLSGKAGLHGLWNNAKGYYSVDTMETKGLFISPTRSNYECYFQINWQRTRGFLCSEKWMQVISVEAANRLRFSYEPSVPEKRVWNFNAYIGWKHLTGSSGRDIGFFFRYYYGIIPNGQFRNTGGYRYAAVSIVYD